MAFFYIYVIISLIETTKDGGAARVSDRIANSHYNRWAGDPIEGASMIARTIGVALLGVFMSAGTAIAQADLDDFKNQAGVEMLETPSYRSSTPATPS